jgi:hypothetical protein
VVLVVEIEEVNGVVLSVILAVDGGVGLMTVEEEILLLFK